MVLRTNEATLAQLCRTCSGLGTCLHASSIQIERMKVSHGARHAWRVYKTSVLRMSRACKGPQLQYIAEGARACKVDHQHCGCPSHATPCMSSTPVCERPTWLTKYQCDVSKDAAYLIGQAKVALFVDLDACFVPSTAPGSLRADTAQLCVIGATVATASHLSACPFVACVQRHASHVHLRRISASLAIQHLRAQLSPGMPVTMHSLRTQARTLRPPPQAAADLLTGGSVQMAQ